jgi:hypothetical protein
MKKASKGPKQRIAFRGKSWQLIIAVAALFFNLTASAQSIPARNKLQPINATGYEWLTGSFKKGVYIVSDTLPTTDTGVLVIFQNQLYQRYPGYWGAIGKAIRLSDSSFLIGRDTLTIGGSDHSIATGSRTATGDYIQNWANHWFYLNNFKSLSLSSNRPDPNHPANNKVFNFYSDTTADATALQLAWGLKDVNNSTIDSVHGELSSNLVATSLVHWGHGSARYAEIDIRGNVIDPDIEMVAASETKASSLTLGSTTYINPNDSLRIKAVPATAAPKVLGFRSISGDVGTVVAMDMPAAHTDTFGIQDNVSNVDRYMNMRGHNFTIDSTGELNWWFKDADYLSEIYAAKNFMQHFIGNSSNGSSSEVSNDDSTIFMRSQGVSRPVTGSPVTDVDVHPWVLNIHSYDGAGDTTTNLVVHVPKTSTADYVLVHHADTAKDMSIADLSGLVGGGVSFNNVAYVDSAYGNDATGQIDKPGKPFATIGAALDATSSLSKRVIDIGVGTFASPDSSKIKSYTWFRGHGKPKPDWTVAVPSVDADTKTAPTKLIGGTILQGSFWFNTQRLQNIIVTDLGVDVGSAWCTASNSGNPAEGFVFTTPYVPGSGTAADGGHFLQSGLTPLQGLVVRNVASLCQSASAAVHAALFENCFYPDIDGVSAYYGTHGIVFKCIGGTASNLQSFGHNSDGVIIKSNDYANCYRLSISNFNIGSIGSYDGAGLLLDAADGGSPGLYFCNISNGTINRTTFGIRTQGSVIDGNNISNIEVNVAGGNGVDIQSGYAYGSLQNIKARSCGGHGFYVASNQPGITINDCDAHDNAGDGFRFSGVTNVNFDNVNAILNHAYGINVLSGNVYGGIRYTDGNTSGSTSGTIISKVAGNLNDVTTLGATTSNAISITGNSTSSAKLSVAAMNYQPYSLNNFFMVENAYFNGSAWSRPSTGYAGKVHYYNGQILLSNANTGSGTPTFITGIKTDFNGHVGLGGNIDDVTYAGSKVFINGSTGEMSISDSLRINNTPIGNTSDSVLVKRNNVVYAVPQNTIGVQILKGSTTWDPASIGANSSTTTNITVTGAALGDPVTISKTSGAYSNGEVYFAYVSATNTVTIQLQNASGGTFDISSATYNVVVLKY